MDTTQFQEDSCYCLSNFSPHAITYKGTWYMTAEHAYQAEKYSNNTDIQARVIEAASPREAWNIAQEKRAHRDPQWNEKKVAVITDIMRTKRDQHKEVRDLLRAYPDAVILKNIPEDSFWAIGPDGNGQNVMGQIWMTLRDELLTQSSRD